APRAVDPRHRALPAARLDRVARGALRAQEPHRTAPLGRACRSCGTGLASRPARARRRPRVPLAARAGAPPCGAGAQAPRDRRRRPARLAAPHLTTAHLTTTPWSAPLLPPALRATTSRRCAGPGTAG